MEHFLVSLLPYDLSSPLVPSLGLLSAQLASHSSAAPLSSPLPNLYKVQGRQAAEPGTAALRHVVTIATSGLKPTVPIQPKEFRH